MTTEEIATELGISREKVQQIERLALRKARLLFLKIDPEENWAEFIINAKAKNVLEQQYGL